MYGSNKRELRNTRTKDKNKTKLQQRKHILLRLYGEPPYLFLGRGQVHLCSLPSELWLLAIWKRFLRSKFFLFQTLHYWLIPRNLPFQVSRVFSPCETKFQNFLGLLGSFTAVTGLRCFFREKHSWSYLACEALDYQLVCVCAASRALSVAESDLQVPKTDCSSSSALPALFLSFTFHLSDLCFVPSYLLSFT